jgi:hypothetical protein
MDRDNPASMRVDGNWRQCDDGVTRPIVYGEFRSATNEWFQVPLLADCGADRSVMSFDVWDALGIRSQASEERIEGVGGVEAIVLLETQLRLPESSGSTVLFKGQFAAVTAARSLDMCILGRNITNLFALIVD